MGTISGIVGTPVTPFAADGAVDEGALRRLVEFLVVRAGSDALSLPQHVGESLNLAEAERRRVAEIGVEQAAGRIPVVVHISTTSTELTVALARHAQEIGAAAVISTVPYHWRPRPAAIVAHFERLCASVEIDVLAYNFPERLGVTITPDLVAGLVERFDNFAGMKDASYDMRYFTAVSQVAAAARHPFALFTGIDYPVPSLALGGAGTFSPLGAVAPDAVQELHRLARAGEREAALAPQQRVGELLTAIGRHGLAAGVKAAMELMGRPAGPTRLPLLPLSEQDRQELRDVLERTGLLGSEPSGWEGL